METLDNELINIAEKSYEDNKRTQRLTKINKLIKDTKQALFIYDDCKLVHIVLSFDIYNIESHMTNIPKLGICENNVHVVTCRHLNYNKDDAEDSKIPILGDTIDLVLDEKKKYIIINVAVHYSINPKSDPRIGLPKEYWKLILSKYYDGKTLFLCI